MELQQFIDSTLRRSGCLTETLDLDRLEVVLAAPVAARLELPEHACLRVLGVPHADEQHVGYGSTLLSSVCALTDSAVRRYRLYVVPAPAKRERLEREAAGLLSFQNATARRESLQQSTLEYFTFDFRYTALSEERHEGLVSTTINAESGCSASFASQLDAYLREHPESRREWSDPGPPTQIQPGYDRARLHALSLVRSATRPFVARMARRLQRDAARVEEYYRSLHVEVQRKKPRRRRNRVHAEGQSPTAASTVSHRDDPVVLQEKLDAIVTERRRRLRDLNRRYSVSLRLEPLAVLVVRIEGYVLNARLQRRKRDRHVQLGWNAVSKEFDQWMCDSCGDETPAPTVCDALHLLCSQCPNKCPSCDHAVCLVCNPGGCDCGWSPAQLLTPR
ncbi:MAG: hypothetical protein JSW67_02770 [Candidatus Latescibacterota bacterium]|nr:MAG: hypothetical protein JSW67_02770 [Candidatus Latescibacterota bacterium]